MAIQNFVSGGFYGKLGQMVGQRWKNKRTLRTYVVPADPKTPAQMKERKRFGGAVPFAQYARLSNMRCTFFNDPNFTEWNYRMRTASQLYENETEFLKRLPLIPYGYSAPFVPTTCKVKITQAIGNAILTLTGILPETKRKISVYATNDPNTENPNDVLLLQAESTDTDPTVFKTSPIGDFEFDNDTQIRIVSNDDRNSELDMILSNPITVEVVRKETRAFDTTITRVEVDGENTYIDFAQDWKQEGNNVTVLSASVAKTWAFVDGAFSSVTLSNNNGKVRLTLVQTDFAENAGYAWTQNTQLILSAISVEDEQYIYVAQNITLEPVETVDRIRQWKYTNGISYGDGEDTIVEQPFPNGLVVDDFEAANYAVSLCGSNQTANGINVLELQSDSQLTKVKFNYVMTDEPFASLQKLIMPRVNNNLTPPTRLVGTWRGLRFKCLNNANSLSISKGKWAKTFTPNWTNTRDEFYIHIDSDILAGNDFRTEQVYFHTRNNKTGVLYNGTPNINHNTQWGYANGHLRIRMEQPTEKLPAQISAKFSVDEFTFSNANYDITISASSGEFCNDYEHFFFKDTATNKSLTIGVQMGISNGQYYVRLNDIKTYPDDYDTFSLPNGTTRTIVNPIEMSMMLRLNTYTKSISNDETENTVSTSAGYLSQQGNGFKFDGTRYYKETAYLDGPTEITFIMPGVKFIDDGNGWILIEKDAGKLRLHFNATEEYLYKNDRINVGGTSLNAVTVPNWVS